MLPGPLYRLFLGLLFFSLSTGFLTAQEAGRQVEVNLVRFQSVRPPVGGDNWTEAEIRLNVLGPVDPAAVNPRYVDKVRIVLNLSFEVTGATGETILRFYRSEVEMPTLERGSHTVRFYLPPEVVRRDRLRTRPQAFLAEVFVDGRQQDTSRQSMDPLLYTETVRQSFRLRISRDAPDNDGILLPIYLTPFANQYTRDTPSFIRRSPGS